MTLVGRHFLVTGKERFKGIADEVGAQHDGEGLTGKPVRPYTVAL